MNIVLMNFNCLELFVVICLENINFCIVQFICFITFWEKKINLCPYMYFLCFCTFVVLTAEVTKLTA